MDDETLIDETKREAGARLLALTDALGLAAVGAGWYRREEAWRYFLVTPLLDSEGPTWVYARLLQVFGKVSLPRGIAAIDVHLVSPAEHLYRDMLTQAAAPLEVVRPFSGEDDIDRIFLYRAGLPARRAANIARSFDRKVRKLMAA